MVKHETSKLNMPKSGKPRISFINCRTVSIWSPRSGRDYRVVYSRAGETVYARCDCAAGRFDQSCWHSQLGARFLAAISKMRKEMSR